MPMLALPAPECDDDKVTQILCGFCVVQQRLNFEPAGRAFHASFEKPKIDAKKKGRDGPSKKDADDSDDDREASKAWKAKKKESGDKKNCGTLKLSHLLEGVDLYGLLEVSEGATSDQIKKSYRQLALKHHPDKQADVPDEKADKPGAGLNAKEQHFIKIQEAYEVLSDDAKRKQYDSTLDFDEDVPEEVDEKVGYYATFGPVFQRNARFSNRGPVPDLGNENTDIAKVHKFFDFWFDFDSWRDFSMHHEYNPEEAEFREERRWMEKQNQKNGKKYVEAERRRIMRLAEIAERLDPRLRAEKEEAQAKKREEKERRARLKQEEEDAKRRKEDEKKEKEEREKAELEEKERLEREQRKKGKEAAKALRQRAKKSVQGACKFSAAEMEEFQDFCLALGEEIEELEALCERMDKLPAKKPAAEAAVRSELAAWKKKRVEDQEEQAKQREEAKQREKQKAANESKESSGAPWGAEEMGFLAKGLQKFPGGVGGRWAVIAQFLGQNGFTRTEKEVIEKTKEMSAGQSLRSMGSLVSSELTTLKGEAAAKASAKAGAKAVAKVAASPASPSSPSDKASPKADAKAAAAPAADPAEWSAEQQKALETALIKHPATLDKNERWRLIAEDVAGKTKSQCVERFKFLREQLVKQKGK